MRLRKSDEPRVRMEQILHAGFSRAGNGTGATGARASWTDLGMVVLLSLSQALLMMADGPSAIQYAQEAANLARGSESISDTDLVRSRLDAQLGA